MTNGKPCWDATKAYFHEDGTVHAWWAPEDPDSVHYEHFSEQLRWLVSQVNWSGKRVLDVGTGKGRLALAAALKGARVTALDLSGEMLGDAHRAAQDAHVIIGLTLADAESLPFPDHSFDLVSCVEGLMHFPDAGGALREIARVTKPGGMVILSVTNWLCLTALTRQINRLARFLRSGPAQGPRIFWYYSLWGLHRLAARAGMTIVKAHGQGLLQATARLPLGRGRFLPLVPRPLADWFFHRVEPAFRETPLLAFMGTISVTCRTKDD
jgi:SAM-dependent methyltransferase